MRETVNMTIILGVVIFIMALCVDAFGQAPTPTRQPEIIPGWIQFHQDPPGYYLPYQSGIAPGSLYFLVHVDGEGWANIIVPASGDYTIGLQLVATATYTPVIYPTHTPTHTPTVTRTFTPTKTPMRTFTPTFTPTPQPTPTRPNALAPGDWSTLYARVRALWAAQAEWDQEWGAK